MAHPSEEKIAPKIAAKIGSLTNQFILGLL
jgi:hypothetical protein